MPAVRVRGLWKRFGEQVAVAGIDLELPAGQFIGLVGPNGAWQDHHPLDGDRAAQARSRHRRGRRSRRLARPGGGEGPDRRTARGTPALRAALRTRTARVHRPVAGPARRRGRQACHPAPRRPRPRGRPAQTGRRLLDRHAQEDRSGLRAPAQPRSPLPGRALRGRGPGLRADHPGRPGAVHRVRRHRRLLLPCDGAGRVAVRLGRRHGRRTHPRTRSARGGAWQRPSLQQAFLELVGAHGCGTTADLDWLGGGAPR